MKGNSVAKYAHKFNKSNVMDDQKKKSKNGYKKHKKALVDDTGAFLLSNPQKSV